MRKAFDSFRRQLSISDPVPTVSRDSPSIGLKVLYDSPNATVDIIAIHGQNGHPITSWTNRDNGVLWFRDLLPGVLKTNPGVDIRVLSYGYSHLDAMEAIGAGLMKSIRRLRAETESEGRRIIWCGHSFGGPLLRAALFAFPSSGDIQASTAAFLFFGAAKNMGLENLNMVLGLQEATLTREMRALRNDMLWLKNGSEVFEREREHIGWRTVWFKEIGSEGQEAEVSEARLGGDEGGAREGYGENEIEVRLAKTHSTMVKFADTGDEDFKVVVERMREVI